VEKLKQAWRNINLKEILEPLRLTDEELGRFINPKAIITSIGCLQVADVQFDKIVSIIQERALKLLRVWNRSYDDYGSGVLHTLEQLLGCDWYRYCIQLVVKEEIERR